MPGLYDPMAYLRGYGQQQKPGIKPLDPEEEQSQLSKWLGKGLGALGYLGGMLDKPGRAVRGVLGGRPEELAAVLPFSDALGLTDESNRVSGRDLLHDAGMLDKSDDSWLGTAAGIGTEIATDPLTYMSFGARGALTPLGEAARKAGVLPLKRAGRLAGLTERSGEAGKLAEYLGKPVGEIAGQRLGGDLGLGIPFMGNNLGTYDLGWLGRGAKTAGNLASHIPVVGPLGSKVAGGLEGLYRGGKALFSKPAGGMLDQAAQAWSEGYHALEPTADAAARRTMTDVLERAQNVGLVDKFHEPVLPGGWDTIRGMGEGHLPAQTPEQQAFFEYARGNVPGKPGGVFGEVLGREQKVGIGGAEQLVDPHTPYYWPRELSVPAKGKFFGGNVPVPPAGREDILKGIAGPGGRTAVEGRGGSVGLNDFSKDLNVSGPNRPLTDLQAASYIEQRIGNPAEWQQLRETKEAIGKDIRKHIEDNRLTPDEAAKFSKTHMEENFGHEAQNRLTELETRKVQATHLQDYLKGLDPAHAADQVGIYDNSPFRDMEQRLLRGERNILKAQQLHGGIGELADTAEKIGQGGVPLTKFLNDANLTLSPMDQVTGKYGGAMQATYDALQKAGKIPEGADINYLDKLFMPKQFAEELTNFRKLTSAPAGMEPVLRLWDSWTNMTKTMQVLPLGPLSPNHVRNQGTFLAEALVYGGHDPTVGGGRLNPLAYTKPWADANALKNGEVVKDLQSIRGWQNLTDAETTKRLQQEAYIHDVPGHTRQQANEVLSTGAERLDPRAPTYVGMKDKGYKEIFGEAIPRSKEEMKPWNVFGVGGLKEDVYSVAKSGRDLQRRLDDTNALAMYIAKRKQGFEPAAAAAEVRRAVMDFSDTTQFENSVMKRLVPFYGWMKQSIKQTVGELAAHPGGLLSQGVRTVSDLEGDKAGFTPEYLSKGVSIPVGQEKEGTQRYLTNFGLPVEDVGRIFNPAGGQRTLQEQASNLNPLIKYPLEMLSGKQMYSGRDLGDLYPMTGSNTLDNMIANSPVSRYATMGRTLGDERKGVLSKAMNLLSGVKVTDVDMEKQKQIEGRQLIEDRLRGQPGVGKFEKLYVKPENVGQLSPDDLMLMRLYQTQLLRQQKLAREKKAAGQ